MTATGDAADLLRDGYDAILAGRPDDAIVRFSSAVRAYHAAGDTRGEAMACARLGELFEGVLSNRVAARPWYERAWRLLEEEEPCVEQGWVAIAPMGCDVDDPAVLAERADLALDRARRFGDVDLEVKALADGGLARVQAGAVAEGMAMIDEAMALACGGAATDTEMLGKAACSFYTACYYTADFERVSTWSELLRRRGVIGTAPGAPAILSSHCDSVKGILLVHAGRWGEAEEILVRAYEAIDSVMPGAAWHPPITLAELRILQGRLAEAEALLLGRDHFVQALLPTARLHLARGDHDLARATARRGLRMIADDRVRAATLLGVLVEAELGRDDLASAAAASAELDLRIAPLGLPALAAEAARLRARVRAAEGDLEAAASDLHTALAALAGTDLPFAKLRTCLDLARVHEQAKDRAAAIVEARAAAATLAQLDVVLPADDAALLERLQLGVEARPAPAPCRAATMTREGSWWNIGCDTARVRLKDTKGLRYLAELVAHPGVERHALDLVDLVEGVAAGPVGVSRRNLGDAGPMADARARSEYRRRIEELREEIDDALAVEDDDRAARAQTDLDALLAELSRAFGLGGRERSASSAAEKARLNVTRALRSAIARVVEALPDAGATLDRRVRTGLYCAYVPHDEDEFRWSVQPRVNGEQAN